jgi:2-keto-3-deoxygluconate permease
MIVPLLFAMVMNSFIPAFFKIGSLTTALFQDGALTLLGFLFFLVGTQFQFGESVKTWGKGFALLIFKLSVGSLAALAVYYYYGLQGMAGITPLALFIALTQPNLAMYIAITLQFGRPAHLGMLPLFIWMETPFFTLLVLDVSGMIETSLADYVAIIIPFILGIGVGYFLKENRKMFSTLIPVVIPFFAFAVGSHFQLSDLLQSGLGGILIAMLVLGSGIVGFFLIRPLSQNNATPGVAFGINSKH